MIVRNEERNLADCLTPVAGLFDEIVIVDTGSQDQTRQIASRFKPHVFDFEWCDDFAAARNESLRRSHGDWIFWLDADDRLSPENVDKLSRLFGTLDGQPRVFQMNTVSPSRYECEGASIVTHLRLFRRHPELIWSGRVHEQLRPAPSTLGHELAWSDVQIEHVGYQDLALCQRKRQRTLRLLRMDYAVNPGDTGTLFHLGMAYARCGNKVEARKHLLQVAALEPAGAPHMRWVHAALAELSLHEGQFHETIQLTDRGLALFPDDEHLLYVRALALYELMQHNAAASTLARIIQGSVAPQFYGGGPGQIKEKLAPRKLAAVRRMLGAYAEAEAVARDVLTRFPDDTQTWYALGLVYIDTLNGQKLAAAVEALDACPQGGLYAAVLRAVWHLQHGQLQAAGDLIEQLIGEAPQWRLPRLLRTEWAFRSGAAVEDQVRALRDLLRLDPGNAEARKRLESLEGAQPASASPPASTWGTSVIVSAAGPAWAAPR